MARDASLHGTQNSSATEVATNESEDEGDDEGDIHMATSNANAPQGDEHDDDDDDDDDGGGADSDSDIEARIAASRRRISPNHCLFCNHRSSDATSNLEHMSRAHSFFVPDQDILVDLNGLLAYLGEKVAIGNLCLFCPNGGKEFGSLAAVRKHMIDKAHCKIAYETEEDRVELADFYDYDGDLGSEQSEWEDVDDEGAAAEFGGEVCGRFSKS